jgi:hypothetical protein
MAFHTTFDFEELKLPGLGEGVLIYGRAKLEDNGDGDFAITSIVLDGRRTLPAPSVTGSNTFDQMLCRMIMDVLYDDKTVDGRHCAQEWADAVTQSRERDPDDARDQRIDDAAFFGHSSAARLERHFSTAAE